jgi:hypothetical protein
MYPLNVLTVLSLLIFISLVNGTQVLNVNLHSTSSCSSSSVDVPMALANTCWNLFGGFSLKFTCATNRLQFWLNSTTCATTPDADQPSSCVDAPTGFPANGFSCGTYPDADVVIMKVGGACLGADANTPGLQDFSFSFVQVVNECLDTPQVNLGGGSSSIPKGKYKVTITGTSVTYQQWTGSVCSGTPETSYTGEIGKCTSISGPGGLGRRLGGSAVIFEKPGGTSPSHAVYSSVSFSALLVLALGIFQIVA